MITKNGYIVLSIILLAFILAACGTPGAADLPETLSATQGVEPGTAIPVTESPVTDVPPTAEAGSGLRPVIIEDVQVEVGVGSPIPVNVIASGTWPDLCAQVAQVEQRLVGTSFEIQVLATPAVEGCPPDHLGLPFRIVIPWNMVEVPAGTYAVSVNGVQTAIAWDIFTASGGMLVDQQAGEPVPLSVAAVTVEVGVGSPIPVEVVASGDWPSLCSQLADVTQSMDGSRIEIGLRATPNNPDCPPDFVGIPFRVAVPLNMVEMPVGTYTIVVNGVEMLFEWTGRGLDQPAAPSAALAYVGTDGNLWLLEASGDEPRQVTTDATPVDANGPEVVSYYFANLSPDGRFLAARRDSGTQVEWGMAYVFELVVYDTQSGENITVLESETPPAGFDWKPGTHLLAYGLGADPNYFIGRGEPDPELATGIFGVDLDSLPEGGVPEADLLVGPERGLSLMLPVWSPDGRFLSFDEIQYMEGRGMFAYYDFEGGRYTSWEEPIGFYDWSPDSSQIAYDRMTYTATGEERIFVRERAGGEEVQVSPEPVQPEYYFFPSFSPDGGQIAYFANLGGPDSMQHTLYVQDLPDGEPRELGGVFESVSDLQWAADGSALLFSAGQFDARQVIQLSVSDGASRDLAPGSQVSVAAP